MEFWGVEVKPGKPTKFQPQYGTVIHISQASLGEVNKDVNGSVTVPLGLKIDGKDFVVGTLVPEDRPQMMLDLVFEKEFELSHGWKNGSVYFLGYTAEDDVSEDELVEHKENGGIKLDAGVATSNGGVLEGLLKKEVSSESDEEGDGTAPNESLDGDSSDDICEQDSEDDDSESEEELPKVLEGVLKKGESSESDDEDDSDSDEEVDGMAPNESLDGDSSDDISQQDSEDDDGESESEEELTKPSMKRLASSSIQAAAAKKAKQSQSTKSRAQ